MKGLAKALLGLAVAACVAWLGICAYFVATTPTVAFSPKELAEAPHPWPSGFLWGTATAAHQVEGGNRNDWSRFEEEPGRIARAERSGLAVDHWNRMAADVALMTALKANAYRFSIEWSRVEPEEGRWDEAAWARYGELLSLLSEARIAPMVTLLHFTLPTWMADRGGVTAPDFPNRFARFAGEASRRFGPEVELWCILNEPNVQMYLGYVTGTWPPAKKSPAEAVQAAVGLLRAHAKGAKAVRAASSRARIGVAMNLVDFQPDSRWSIPDWLAARGAADSFNWAFYDGIRTGRIRFDSPGFPKVDEPLGDLLGSADWFGANYYTRNLVHFSPTEPGMVALRTGSRERNDLGWEIYPEGLLTLLHAAARRYALPIYVTENGIPDAAGSMRESYLRSHVHAVSRAIAEGVPVRGYFYWSLMDNFEWAEGFAPRFGLYKVDYATLARTPAGGSEAFRDLAPAP